MNLNILYVTFILISLLFVRCKDDDEVPKEEVTFDLKYVLNLEGYEETTPKEGDITSIELTMITYYPKVNKSEYTERNFQRVQFKNGIFHYPKSPVYIGCERQIRVSISKLFNRNGDLLAGKFRYYYFEVDTVKFNHDSLYIINWPTDSLKAYNID